MISASGVSDGFAMIEVAPAVSISRLDQYALLRSPRQQHRLQRMENDVVVERHGHILDVIKIVFELGDGVFQSIAVFVIDLRPSGDAGADAMALAVVRNLLAERLYELGTFRARPDNRHLALQNIVKLRQLIEAYPADESANGGHAGVVFLRPNGAGARFRVQSHGAELINGEVLTLQPYANLPVQDRAARGEPDGERGH